MADAIPQSFEPRKEQKSGSSLGKMFIVVFVAAVVGSYVGGSFSGFSSTGFLVGNAGPEAGPTPSPSPSPSPEPAGPTVRMSDLAQGAFYYGDQNAPVTIVEFTDAQCPFCGRHKTNTFGSIMSDYVEKGKVVYYKKHFPLSFHPEAQKGSEALECARDQRKFKEMDDLIFANQQIMNVPKYKEWSQQLGMDTQAFSNCIDSGKYAQKVQDDFALGSRSGVSGTPSFFIGKTNGEGKIVVGAQPFQVFKAEIDAALA